MGKQPKRKVPPSMGGDGYDVFSSWRWVSGMGVSAIRSVKKRNSRMERRQGRTVSHVWADEY